MGRYVEIGDPRYPKALENITGAPDRLYYVGDWCSDIFENCLAVVGSRHATAYGKKVVKKLITELSSRGITIVSGFMYGIDAKAHRACVNVGGRTMAVLPYGIEHKGPAYQEDLYDLILENKGLVLSEYNTHVASNRWQFVARNRIVVGLSKAVLIVEGALGSGSLVTADLACKHEKKLFAVCGPIDSEVSKGTNILIKEGKAEMVTCVEDILSFFNFLPGATSTNIVCEQSRAIIKLLENKPLALDEIVREIGLSAKDAGAKLTGLILSGNIIEEGNKFHVG